MKVKVNGKIEAWHGIWPARKNSRKIVCVLEGSVHTGLDDAEYLGTHYSRSDGEYFDWYRLPAGIEIVKVEKGLKIEGGKK
jgi:hypothetical protein